jgi:hypothetical protein
MNSQSTTKVNWPRVFGCGTLAGIVWIALGSIVTALLIAAFAWWFIVSLGDVTWCSFGLFPPLPLIPLMIGTLPALLIATLIGAKFYKD